jgi:hypothetical protein
MGQRTWAEQLAAEQERLRTGHEHLETTHGFHGGPGGLDPEPPATLEAVRVAGGRLWQRHHDLQVASEQVAWQGQWHPGMHLHHGGHPERYDELPKPGTRVFCYGTGLPGPGNLGTATGVQIPVIEKLFEQPGYRPLTVVVRFDDGHEDALSPLIVHALAEVRAAWHVLAPDGRILAGGPRILEARAHELAGERGGQVHRGLPGLPAADAPLAAPAGERVAARPPARR